MQVSTQLQAYQQMARSLISRIQQRLAGSSLDEFYIELKEDGTGSINANGEAQNLTWDKKNITVDGEAVPYTVKGNELSIVQEGITIKAEKE